MDAAATAWGQLPFCVCSRSMPRSSLCWRLHPWAETDGPVRGYATLRRDCPASCGSPPLLPVRDRTDPSQPVHPDWSCSRFRPTPPWAWQKRRGTGLQSDRENAPQSAWLLRLVSTWESGSPRTDSGWNRPGEPAPRTRGSAACRSLSSDL